MLQVGNRKLGTSSTSPTSPNDLGWHSTGLSWSQGDQVSLRLTMGSGAGGASGNSGPSPTSSSVSGTKLKMTFDEPLSQGLAPPGGSFKVTVGPGPQGGARGNGGVRGMGGAGANGGTGAQSTSAGDADDIPGTGTATVDGTEVAVTLARAPAPGATLTVAYTPPDDGTSALRGLSGGKVAEFSDEPVTRAAARPAVTAVAVVSDPGDHDTYALGDAIEVRVTFDAAVDVDTSGGAPHIAIDMDPADWGVKHAAYAGGSGTSSLTFAYEVAEPNLSEPGIAVVANSLAANGGAIRAAAGGADAALAHPGLDHDPAHKVDWQFAPPADGPAVTGVSIASMPAADDTYRLGETIRVALTFDQTVEVDTTGGTPAVTIDMDPDAGWGEKVAVYAGGSGTVELVFEHEVVEPNLSTQGIAVLADSLDANGGTIRSADGTDAALAHAGLDHDPAHKVDWALAPPANAAPAVDTGAAEYGAFTGAGNAPRGTHVSKPFNGLFSDPDGDELTFTVALADESQAVLVELLAIPTAEDLGEHADDVRLAQRVHYRADADSDWDALDPAPPNPVSVVVTVTATDPGGLSASVDGVFQTTWEPRTTPSVTAAAVRRRWPSTWTRRTGARSGRPTLAGRARTR